MAIIIVPHYVLIGLPLALLKLYYPFDHQMLRVLTWDDISGALSLSESMLRKLLVSATYLVVIFNIMVQGLPN